ncbi:MAG: chromosome partitioning protein [Acidimicrobiia bacterium]|nr:chromosome partitioning protein [Acidimicrobiia bacterium]
MTDMTDVIEVVVCAGGAAWELPLVRAFQRRELGVRVARRCVDHGELLGTALRDRPTAVVLDASLPWLDRDLVTTLRRAGIEAFAIGNSARLLDRLGVHCLALDATPELIAAALYSLESPVPCDPRSAAGVGEAADGTADAGRIVAVWGGAGSPGRTTVAVHVAIETARAGARTLLIDGDAWSASVAQLLELHESPSLAQAARLAADGWPSPFDTTVQFGPNGLAVLAGLARAELWPEVREIAWRGVLAAATTQYDVVVVDLAAPIEEDEELAYDRVPYRRNLLTRIALERADDILLVAAADPVGLRRAVVAHRNLTEGLPDASRKVRVVLNRAPRAGRRLQECSRSVEEWMGDVPAALLPEEAALGRVGWEGRPLTEIAPRSRWLRELRSSLAVVRS